ncbi:MAG: hypothetical protein CL398_09070 [Acidiferrobacteraceae bacterium]|nr:hypothetical protein [Acidiferrobacteraceae bacterium]
MQGSRILARYGQEVHVPSVYLAFMQINSEQATLQISIDRGYVFLIYPAFLPNIASAEQVYF